MSELYGPYYIAKNESFVFAQQFDYDRIIYQGSYLLTTRILKNSKILRTDSFIIELGNGHNESINVEATSNLIAVNNENTQNALTGAIVGTIKTSFIDGFMIVMFLAILGLLFLKREKVKQETVNKIMAARFLLKEDKEETDIQKSVRESNDELERYIK